ncbi:LuxR C-terminal-related transcriptional regulator, partial [Legionella sp.]|uniref:LuxR C-terminal-related transcriptional regulator n=1 Tax=Legionella sp. TaxID=459 RepID=UPI003CC6D529
MVARSKTAPQIARFLSLSDRQIRRYKENILRELGCNNITQAVVMGIRYGKIP